MSYSNSPVPQGTNISDTSNALILIKLVVIVLVALIATLYIVIQGTRWAVTHLPFEYEVMLAENMALFVDQKKPNNNTRQAQNYLQALADTIATKQDLPADMPITIHLKQDEQINAYATIGGHVFIHQGLLQKLNSENAVTMLLGHEIAHIYHRDPIQSLGGSLLAGVMVEWLTGGSGWGAAFIGNQAARLVSQGFSRDQERAADQFGAVSLHTIYGHTGGATDLFQVLMQYGGNSGDGIAEFWSSHPDTQERLNQFQTSHLNQSLQPLKVDFSQLGK